MRTGAVRVAVFARRTDAEIAVQMLAGYGTDGWVAADDDGGVTGVQLSLRHQGAEVQVRAEQEQHARELLDIEPEELGRDTVASRTAPPWQVVVLIALFVGIALVQLLAG